MTCCSNLFFYGLSLFQLNIGDLCPVFSRLILFTANIFPFVYSDETLKYCSTRKAICGDLFPPIIFNLTVHRFRHCNAPREVEMWL